MKTILTLVFASLLILLTGCDNDSAAQGPANESYVEQSLGQLDPADPEPIAETDAKVIGESPDATAADPIPPTDPVAPSAYVVIQNAAVNDTQLLIRQLQQVLPKTQVVKQVQSPNPREIKLEVTNIKDVRALANKIPFASVELVDVATRTITVDFDL
jgi:hypothetical protein